MHFDSKSNCNHIYFTIPHRVIYYDVNFCTNVQNLPDNDTNVVAFTSDLCLLSHNHEHSNHRLASTKDRVFMYSPTFLFRKLSPLVAEFNKQLQSLQETGLIDYWIRNNTDTRKSTANITPTKLKMTSISAIFQLCGAMYAVSFVVFILEVLSVRFRYLKRFVDYLTY